MRNVRKLYNLSEEVKFCKKCVMSNQGPRIVFDEEEGKEKWRMEVKKASVINLFLQLSW